MIEENIFIILLSLRCCGTAYKSDWFQEDIYMNGTIKGLMEKKNLNCILKGVIGQVKITKDERAMA